MHASHNRPVVKILSLLAVVASIAACDATVTDPAQHAFGLGGTTGPSHAPAGGETTGMFTLTNAARGQAGVAPVTASARLSAAAALLCQEIAQTGVIAHDQPGTAAPTLADRLHRAGYAYSTAAENLTYGPDSTAALAVQDFLNSPDHRAALLSPTYTEYGDALQKIGADYCWVQEFAAP